MAECEKLSGCAFFNDRLGNMPGIADMLKEQFCRGDFHNCARYLVSNTLGGAAVPSSLYPNMKDKAKEMIENAG